MSVQNEGTEFSVDLPVTLRQMRESDLPGLEWNGEFTHFRNVFRRSYNDQEEGRRYLLVADCNNFPIGRLFILFKSRNLQIADGVTRAYLYSFAVMDMFQGRGIGTKMILATEALLRQWQYVYATIAVAQDNEGALRLYKRHDYRVFGEDDGRWRYTDHRGITRHVYEPCWLLEKRLVTKP
jgi:ribosomal protein S18 acetylase RimI-like enzyme